MIMMVIHFASPYLGSPEDNPSVLYRNNGDGTFTDASAISGINHLDGGHAGIWGDYDNDGDMDLFITNNSTTISQSPPISTSGKNVLYRNNNDGTFTDIAETAGVLNTGNGEGAAWGDYNNDGFMDLYAVNYRETNRLFQNNGNDNHWIIIKTVGITNNKDGIGARIEITTDSGSQIREVDGGSGFCSQDSVWAHFGLGSDDNSLR